MRESFLPDLGVGLIGTGFMGRAHALAFHNARTTFELPVNLKLVALADADAGRAEQCARSWGFDRSHADWQQLISDPSVQLVAITTPNHLHFPMAMAALEAGKAVYCEKPLAVSLEQAREMQRAAKAAGVVTRVGYNYQHNPMIGLARQMIESGDLGQIVSFQGEFSEDFMGDPQQPWSWRCEQAHAGGALADLGSHLLAMARYLLGDVEAVCADSQTVHAQRPATHGSSDLRQINEHLTKPEQDSRFQRPDVDRISRHECRELQNARSGKLGVPTRARTIRRRPPQENIVQEHRKTSDRRNKKTMAPPLIQLSEIALTFGGTPLL